MVRADRQWNFTGALALSMFAVATAHAQSKDVRSDAADEPRLYTEDGQPISYEQLSERERRLLDSAADELTFKSPGGDTEPAGCVAGHGMAYCWGLGYMCVATITPFFTLSCFECVYSSCE